MEIEIFKTNVATQEQADYLIHLLQQSVSDGLINFDLEDSNRILRVRTNREISGVVCSLVAKQGFYCQKL